MWYLFTKVWSWQSNHAAEHCVCYKCLVVHQFIWRKCCDSVEEQGGSLLEVTHSHTVSAAIDFQSIASIPVASFIYQSVEQTFSLVSSYHITSTTCFRWNELKSLQQEVTSSSSSSSSVSRSRWVTLRRSNSMAWRMGHIQSFTGELLESRWIWSIHHMWVYQGVISRREQEDDQLTNRCTCGAPCSQDHHSQARQCVQNRDTMGCQL